MFWKSRSQREKAAITVASNLLTGAGVPTAQAEKMATTLTDEVVRRAKAEGMYQRSPTPEELLSAEKRGQTPELFRLLRDEGTTDDDIRGYWGIDILIRLVEVEVDNFIRMNRYAALIASGLDPTAAAKRMQYERLVFGDSDMSNDPSRPLPRELASRISRSLSSGSMQVYLNEVKAGQCTMNAAVRRAIRDGVI